MVKWVEKRIERDRRLGGPITTMALTPDSLKVGKMKTFKPLARNRIGISTILAALLMVVIVMVMSVIVYSWSTGIFGGLLGAPPNAGSQALSLESASFPGASNTNLTLYLRNIGSAPVTLVTWYVTDSNSNQYSRGVGSNVWTGAPSNQAPTVLITVKIYIGTSCGCNTPSTPFTFITGNSYTVVLVSSRNNQFPFTIVRGSS